MSNMFELDYDKIKEQLDSIYKLGVKRGKIKALQFVLDLVDSEINTENISFDLAISKYIVDEGLLD